MRRREFIGLLGSAAAAWPVVASAQQPGKPTIGILGSGTPATQSQWTAAFMQRMRELGWVEGQNIAIEYRWAEGHTDRLPELAMELVRLKVAIVLTHNTPPMLAAKQATATIPIVFATSGDPVGAGIVASLARPGGNITGLSSQAPDAAGKRLELLLELIPGLRHLASLADVGNPYAMLDVGEFRRAAHTLGLEVTPIEISGAEEIAPALEALKGRAQALYVVAVPLFFAERIRINTLAVGMRLVTMHGVREYVEAGGLMSYGPNWPDMWRRSANFVDKILRGTKPADLPVEQPTKFDLVINMITARALGLEIPATLLARADEVIE
jgi:putative tryptophan/tyrosine transport system substrate-binding protein